MIYEYFRLLPFEDALLFANHFGIKPTGQRMVVDGRKVTDYGFYPQDFNDISLEKLKEFCNTTSDDVPALMKEAVLRIREPKMYTQFVPKSVFVASEPEVIEEPYKFKRKEPDHRLIPEVKKLTKGEATSIRMKKYWADKKAAKV